MSKPKEETRYIINLSSNDYVTLKGFYLGNIRDDFVNCGDERNKKILDEAIKIIDNNLVVKEVQDA
tara:strand:- start:24433 stop:24630 length:198 start_codon:yes stop_codon:yes gene_type:complete